MFLTFQSLREPIPGPAWATHFRSFWPAYRAWYLAQGDQARPGYLSCEQALEQHMPELVGLWKELCRLAGGGDVESRMLSLWCPPAYLAGCSQVAWSRPGGPALVRNYDYHPERLEGLFLYTEWLGTSVIASIDSLWGVLDGMNEHGLCAALGFGGRKVVGEGFGIPIILRYVLQTCRTTAEAVAVLERVPSHMAYAITVIDRNADQATVHVAPDQPAVVSRSAVAANHRGALEWPEYAALTNSAARSELLLERVSAPDETLDGLLSRFGQKPLFSDAYIRGFGTLYTAIYWPERGEAEFRWPRRSWHQSFDRFVQGTAVIRYDDPSAAPVG